MWETYTEPSGLKSPWGKRSPHTLDEKLRDEGSGCSLWSVVTWKHTVQTHCDQSRSLETVIFFSICRAALTTGMDIRLSVSVFRDSLLAFGPLTHRFPEFFQLLCGHRLLPGEASVPAHN